VRVDPGEFTRKVKLQSPVVNSAGEQSGEWTLEAEPWVSIEPLAGRELYLIMQVAPRVTHLVTMHYMAGVESDWRIMYGTRVFHIDRVINLKEANVKLEFLCIENPQTTV
jgi:SPP1 family predicted phage head-tail adaptor